MIHAFVAVEPFRLVLTASFFVEGTRDSKQGCVGKADKWYGPPRIPVRVNEKIHAWFYFMAFSINNCTKRLFNLNL